MVITITCLAHTNIQIEQLWCGGKRSDDDFSANGWTGSLCLIGNACGKEDACITIIMAYTLQPCNSCSFFNLSYCSSSYIGVVLGN